MKIKIFFFTVLLAGIVAFALAQERTITGQVTNASDGLALAGVHVSVKGTQLSTTTDLQGKFALKVPSSYKALVFSHIGFKIKTVKIGIQNAINVKMESNIEPLADEIVYDKEEKKSGKDVLYSMPVGSAATKMSKPYSPSVSYEAAPPPPFNTEDYSAIKEIGFQTVKNNPVTTFSIDVDRAAYSNIRRFLNQGQLPNKDAVRIEEMVNYFDYAYPQPTGEHPIATFTELSDSPWNKGLKLLHIGLQAKKVPTDRLPASNLVFLIDVSGSMSDANKLPLLRQSFKLLVDQLRPQDEVAIVVYAGAAGLVLPSTSGQEKTKIKDALDKLEAGGSTAGGEGIKLAYKIATENLKKGGNNRVILATDGDFNIGASSDAELQRMIEQKRESGVYLSVLGFGMGNYKDNKMETLADKGNGNYAYIDNLQEGQKVFVSEFGGTLFTVAKDVKLQLEFNPKYVKAYRLIGYENRMLQNEDFHDDKKDAGEMGSGHTVTALYEIVPAGIESSYLAKLDPLKYQEVKENASASNSPEMLTLKIRYKKPDADRSVLMETVVLDKHTKLENTSANFRFSAAVAEFGLLLRNSEFKGTANYDEVIVSAKNAFDKDEEGYRAEFVRLVKTAKLLTKEPAVAKGE